MISTRIKDVDMVFETAPSIFCPIQLIMEHWPCYLLLIFYYLIKYWIWVAGMVL